MRTILGNDVVFFTDVPNAGEATAFFFDVSNGTRRRWYFIGGTMSNMTPSAGLGRYVVELVLTDPFTGAQHVEPLSIISRNLAAGQQAVELLTMSDLRIFDFDWRVELRLKVEGVATLSPLDGFFVVAIDMDDDTNPVFKSPASSGPVGHARTAAKPAKRRRTPAPKPAVAAKRPLRAAKKTRR